MRKEISAGRACGSSRSHGYLAIDLVGTLDPTEAGRAQAELDSLAATLKPLWSLSPREQLVGCAAAMAKRFQACGDHGLEDLLLHHVLARRVGHPLLLAIVAADVGRRAGLPVGLVGHGPKQHLAHVVLPEPIVADPGDGFALLDLRGRERTVRWPDPIELAATLLQLVAETAQRAGDVERASKAVQTRSILPSPVSDF